MQIDYYGALGITKDATQQEIDKAYKKLVIQNHPDRMKDAASKAAANKKMAEVNEAYETLKDPAKRRKYNEYISSGFRESSFSEYSQQHGMHRDYNFEDINLNDIFKQFFSSDFDSNDGSSYSGYYSSNGEFNEQNQNDYFGARYSQGHSYHPGKDNVCVIHLSVTLKDWFCGSKQNVQYKRRIECSHCKDKRVKCRACKGRGIVSRLFGYSNCSSCSGLGYSCSINCSVCVMGIVSKEEKISITIPRFAQSKLRVSGYGNFFKGKYYDLQINLTILEDQNYKIKGVDLYTEVKVDIQEFLTGIQKKIVFLDDNDISFKIPAMSTEYVVVKNKGVKKDGVLGNLYIKPKVFNSSNKEIKDIVGYINNNKKS